MEIFYTCVYLYIIICYYICYYINYNCCQFIGNLACETSRVNLTRHVAIVAVCL